MRPPDVSWGKVEGGQIFRTLSWAQAWALEWSVVGQGLGRPRTVWAGTLGFGLGWPARWGLLGAGLCGLPGQSRPG